MFVVAKTDTFAFPDETDWIKKQLGPEMVIENIEIEGGHIAFFLLNDMSYFQKNVMKQVKKYNPIIKFVENSYSLL